MLTLKLQPFEYRDFQIGFLPTPQNTMCKSLWDEHYLIREFKTKAQNGELIVLKFRHVTPSPVHWGKIASQDLSMPCRWAFPG